MREKLQFGMIRSALMLLVALGASQARSQTAPDVGVRFQPPTSVFLTGARIVISADHELDSASLLIRDGKIAAIGASLEPPAGAEVIDLSGKHVYPALVDPLVEFDARPIEYPAGYWNASVLPQLRMDQVARLEGTQLDALRKSGIAIALVAPKEGIIKGQSCVVSTSGESLEKCLLRSQAFQHLRLFPSRGSRTSYPNSPMGAVALVRQALSDADWYQQAWQSVKVDPSLPAPEYDAALAALNSVITAEQAVIIDGTNELYALRGDRLAREFSLKAIVRGSGREYRRLEAVMATKRPLIIPINFPDAPEVSSRIDAANTTLQALMHWRLAPENPARLEKAGVSFVFTTDGLEKPGRWREKVRVAIEHGLSEKVALRALTEGPAKLLDLDAVAGTLEEGKLANLIVASGTLFDKSTKIDETWVQGKRFQWNPTQPNDLRGDWKLVLNDPPKSELVLNLTGDPEKLKGKFARPAGSDPEVSDEGDSGADGSDSTSDLSKSPDDEKADDQPTKKPETKGIELKKLQFDGYRLTATFASSELIEGQDGVAIFGAAWIPSPDGSRLVGTISWADGDEHAFVATPIEVEEGDAGKDDSQGKAADTDEEKGKDDEKDKATDEGQTDKVADRVACEVNFPLGAYGLSAPPEQPEWVLVKNATIWTCGEAGILEAADLLVHNGLIESVGQSIVAPEGAVIVDATGMHVTPGIIDCHSHMATDGGVNESAQAITAEVRIGDFIDPNDITIYRQLAGGVTAANILHGSANPIGGQNQVIKLRWGSTDEQMKMREAPAGIKFALGENVKRSNSRSDTVRYPATRMGVEQIIRDRFEAAILYRQRWDRWSETPVGLPPRRDFELEAIAEIVEGKRWVHCHSYRADEILTMLRTLDDYGITIGSLQHILEGYKVADAMAAHGATGSSFSDWWAYKFEVYDAIPFNGALMHRAGVVVSFNSDDAELARHLNHEAAKAVKYGGVAPEEALKFVTLNPAKQLRIDDWVGSLEPGKHADFVVWNRSPLSTLSMCTQTWIDGRKYFDRDSDLARREDDAKLHRELVQSIIGSGAKTRSGESDDDPSTWWARYDEFCHHHHDHDEQHRQHDHHDEQLESEGGEQ